MTDMNNLLDSVSYRSVEEDAGEEHEVAPLADFRAVVAGAAGDGRRHGNRLRVVRLLRRARPTKQCLRRTCDVLWLHPRRTSLAHRSYANGFLSFY